MGGAQAQARLSERWRSVITSPTKLKLKFTKTRFSHQQTRFFLFTPKSYTFCCESHLQCVTFAVNRHHKTERQRCSLSSRSYLRESERFLFTPKGYTFCCESHLRCVTFAVNRLHKTERARRSLSSRSYLRESERSLLRPPTHPHTHTHPHTPTTSTPWTPSNSIGRQERFLVVRLYTQLGEVPLDTL